MDLHSVREQGDLRARGKRGGSFRSVVFAAAFVGALLALGWMLVVPRLAVAALEDRTGFPVSVKSMGSNPFGFTVSARDLTIGNREPFGVGSLLEVGELAALIEMRSLEGDVLVFRNLELHIRRLSLVVSEGGVSNLSVFYGKLDGMEKKARLERVHLTVDEIDVVDYSNQRAERRQIRVGRSWTLENLDSFESLFAPLESMARVGL